ncbi:hypothetical protein AB0E62_28930 [Streptomyces sp. NPDC038707]|uniref:hypothetical protein n=1 Tax=Streptomyces sp. NPDC038707 TaxID=3154329 RepID=UPI0033C02481
METLSDSVRSAVEEIVGDFRKQFGSARERPALDDLTAAAQKLLQAESTPDDVLWEGARLLDEVTAQLGPGGSVG